MWPKYLRRAAATGTDALGDALVRTAAAAMLVLGLLGTGFTQGGTALFFGALAILTLPVTVLPRLCGLIAGNLIVVLSLLVFFTTGGLLTALGVLPLLAIAVFFMLPHLAGRLAMRYVPAERAIVAPPAQVVMPEPKIEPVPAEKKPPAAGPTPPA